MSNSARSILAGFVVALSLVAPVMATEAAPEDPAAMAALYSKQAADLRAAASKHSKIARMHRSGTAGSSKTSHQSIANHCEKIASNLTAAAAETEALAATYQKMVSVQPARQ